jgi:hypothetical protein
VARGSVQHRDALDTPVLSSSWQPGTAAHLSGLHAAHGVTHAANSHSLGDDMRHTILLRSLHTPSRSAASARNCSGIAADEHKNPEQASRAQPQATNPRSHWDVGTSSGGDAGLVSSAPVSCFHWESSQLESAHSPTRSHWENARDLTHLSGVLPHDGPASHRDLSGPPDALPTPRGSSTSLLHRSLSEESPVKSAEWQYSNPDGALNVPAGREVAQACSGSSKAPWDSSTWAKDVLAGQRHDAELAQQADGRLEDLLPGEYRDEACLLPLEWARDGLEWRVDGDGSCGPLEVCFPMCLVLPWWGSSSCCTCMLLHVFATSHGCCFSSPCQVISDLLHRPAHCW